MSEKEPKNTLTPSTDELTICRVCREPIKAGAIKCTKCDSYQDWTRHLLRWSTLLVSLLGLAPLWIISSSLSKLAFSNKAAHIEAAVTGCEQDSVRLVFENSGEISGIVTGVTFALLQDGKRSIPDLDIRSNQGEEDIVISPQQPPVRVVYRPYIDNTPANFIPESRAQQNCFYQLGIDWIDFAGSHQHLTRECRCP